MDLFHRENPPNISAIFSCIHNKSLESFPRHVRKLARIHSLTNIKSLPKLPLCLLRCLWRSRSSGIIYNIFPCYCFSPMALKALPLLCIHVLTFFLDLSTAYQLEHASLHYPTASPNITVALPARNATITIQYPPSKSSISAVPGTKGVSITIAIHAFKSGLLSQHCFSRLIIQDRLSIRRSKRRADLQCSHFPRRLCLRQYH